VNSFLDLLFEDNHCLAVSKPAGLLTQGAGRDVPTLESLVKTYLKEKHHKTGRVYLGIPHRLDRPVSGVVLFGRQTKSAQRLAEQFHNRQVVKVYWAAVEGDVQPADGTWEDWLRKVPEEARAVRAEAGEPHAKLARLRYRCLRAVADGTLLEIMPETGRMHQIRVQAALRGHAVMGDERYGSTRIFGPPTELPRDRLIALHARSLTFLHPIRYEPITVTAPLPAVWQELGIDEITNTDPR
jgi:23S rRNA pseudouridine1911/1915/1917 synthase